MNNAGQCCRFQECETVFQYFLTNLIHSKKTINFDSFNQIQYFLINVIHS